MASTIKVDKLEGSTGSTITVPTGQSLTLTDGLAVSSLPVVTVAKGGTNIASFAAGDLLYATGSTTLAKLPKGAAEKVLSINSGATAPEWTDVDLTVLPTISVAKGGTNLSSFTAGDVLYATGATTLAKLPKGTAEQVLAMNSGATAPDWGSIDLTVLPTITVAKGGTNIASFTAGDILYATGSTTLAKLAKGTGSQQLAMNSGATAPEWITAGGGGYWSEVTSGTATGNTTINFTSLPTGKIFKLLITGKIGNPAMHLSDDNGSSWYTSSGNYKFIGDAWASNDTATTTYRNNSADNMFDQSGFYAYGHIGQYLEVTIANMSNSGLRTVWRGQSAGTVGNVNVGVLGGATDAAFAATAMRFVPVWTSSDFNYMLLKGDE